MNLKLMPEYGCSPLWISKDNDFYENIDIENNSFFISNDLKNRIKGWAEKYEETLNQNYPPDSNFKNKIEEIVFTKEGLGIWEDLISQLKHSYKVCYYCIVQNKQFNSRTEYPIDYNL